MGFESIKGPVFENAAPEYQSNNIANFLLLFSTRPVRFSNILAIPSRRNRRFPTASSFGKPAKRIKTTTNISQFIHTKGKASHSAREKHVVKRAEIILVR